MTSLYTYISIVWWLSLNSNKSEKVHSNITFLSVNTSLAHTSSPLDTEYVADYSSVKEDATDIHLRVWSRQANQKQTKVQGGGRWRHQETRTNIKRWGAEKTNQGRKELTRFSVRISIQRIIQLCTSILNMAGALQFVCLLLTFAVPIHECVAVRQDPKCVTGEPCFDLGTVETMARRVSKDLVSTVVGF